MAKHDVADEAAVERLRREIARERRRLAHAMAMAPEPPLIEGQDGEPTRVGRLHRIFALMGEC